MRLSAIHQKNSADNERKFYKHNKLFYFGKGSAFTVKAVQTGK